MTVKEVIKELSKYPDDAEVVAHPQNQFSYRIIDIYIWDYDERKRIVLEGEIVCH